MTPVILNTMPTEDVNFIATYTFNGSLHAIELRNQDGVLEVYDTLVEDEWEAIESLDETLAQGYEVINYITYIED